MKLIVLGAPSQAVSTCYRLQYLPDCGDFWKADAALDPVPGKNVVQSEQML